MESLRIINKIYIIQTIDDGEIVKVCSNRELAEYYRELLTPIYLESFDVSLVINEYPIVHFKTETIKIGEDEYLQIVQENLNALVKLNNIKKIIEE